MTLKIRDKKTNNKIASGKIKTITNGRIYTDMILKGGLKNKENYIVTVSVSNVVYVWSEYEIECSYNETVFEFNTNATVENRRKHVRLDINSKMEFEVKGSKGTGNLVNISAGGIGFSTMTKLEYKDIVRFKITNPDCLRSENLVGCIIRTEKPANGKGYVYGCRLLDDNEVIENYVKGVKAK